MFDAAIVGGGLAGCSAAITLAQHGHRVVLLESLPYPHHKVCGEFLSPECSILFNELGLLPAIQAAQPIQIRSATINAPDQTRWTTRLPDAALGISRYCLDALLAEGATRQGVTVHDSATVTDITGNLASGYQLAIKGGDPIEARTVITAHGKRSRLDRTLNRDFFQQPQPFVGLKCHFSDLPLADRIELHFFRGGYCGMSEVENGHTNVCLLVRQDVFQAKANGSIPAFIAWMCEQNPLLNERLTTGKPVFEKWMSIAQVPIRRKSLIENGMLMAGDSAAMIAPLAGDGMGMALAGGQLAAHHLHGYLDGRVSADGLQAGYVKAWQREFSTRLRLAKGLQALMLYPAILSPGLKVIKRLPALGNWLVRQTRGMHLIQQQKGSS